MRVIAAGEADRQPGVRRGRSVVETHRRPKPGKRQRLNEASLVAFFSNLATLLNSGIPLIKSLETLKMDDTFKNVGPMLDAIVGDIRSGSSFAAALEKHPGCFSLMIISLLRAAETGGTLVPALERIAENIEKSRETKMKIRQALTYPCIVTVLGAGAVCFLMVYVVPIFEETYEKAGMTLPTVTVVMLALSGVATKIWWMVLIAITALFLAYRKYGAHPAVRALRDRVLIRLPLLGPVLRGVVVGRFVQSFGSLMASGVSIKESLALTERVVQHSEFAEMLHEMRLAVARGEGMTGKMAEYRTLFPPLLTQMMKLGETNGELGNMVIQVGRFVEKDLARRTAQMSLLLEPVVTIGMAATIGTVAMAIYLPMFDMFKQPA